MTKEEFTNIYNKEMEELSYVENAINELGFQMDGKVTKHDNCLYAFENQVHLWHFQHKKVLPFLCYKY